MLGLDGAGKTAALYRMKLGKFVPVIPTISFNTESVEFNNLKVQLWDLGGAKCLRSVWRNRFWGDKQSIILVVDANDLERIDEARDELRKLLKDDNLKNAILLVYANKQDLPRALTPQEVANRLGLGSIGSRPWFVQAACAATGDGLLEGLDWVVKQHIKKI
jgi:small GTP-binding protein